MAAAVEVRAEAHTLIGDFAQMGETVDLKTAGVREHGPGPADKTMQAA